MRARRLLASSILGLFAMVAACGYHPVYGGSNAEHLRVVLVRSLVPDAVATDEVVSGLRETLAREGALASGEGYPRVEVEVLRADETSEGVAAPSAQLGGSLSSASGAGGAGGAVGVSAPTGPRARGTEVGLVARACLVRRRGGECERDTGDVRATDLGASDVSLGNPDVVSDAFHHRDLIRAVGKRLGERLARHILGEATANDEAVGREK